LSVLSLAGDQRQLPCGDDYKEYVVHLDSGFAIHCTTIHSLVLRTGQSDFGSPGVLHRYTCNLMYFAMSSVRKFYSL
jgi:hypothetical protein